MKQMGKGEEKSFNHLEALSDSKCAQSPSLQHFQGISYIPLFFILRANFGETSPCSASEEDPARTRDVKQTPNRESDVWLQTRTDCKL